MKLSTVEYIAGTMAVVVPLCGVIWVGVRTIDRLDDGLYRLNKLENQVAEMNSEQIEDDLVNENVKDLQEAVDWLRFHHHSAPGGDTGRAHVD